MRYKVTTELITPWWKNLLRWLRFSKPIVHFEAEFKKDYFRTGIF
jgi:hypothetical protein